MYSSRVGYSSLKIKHIFIAILAPLLLYTLFVFTKPLYVSTDSMQVAIITNGLYGEDNYCQYIHPLLCVIIKVLATCLPKTDCFTFLIHLMLGIGFGFLFYLFAGDQLLTPIRDRTLYDHAVFLISVMGMLFVSMGLHIWNVNYTIQTAAITFFGLLILFAAIVRQQKFKWIIYGSVITAFGFMLRIESALLFIPFIMLETEAVIGEILISNKTVNKNNAIRHLAKCLLPMLVIIVGLIVSRQFFWSVEPYKTALKYSDNRTVVVDYPMKSWSEDWNRSVSKKTPDNTFSREDYEAARRWYLADTDRMTEERLEAIGKAGTQNQYPFTVDGFSGVLHEMGQMVFHTNIYFLLLVAFSLLLAFRNLIICQSVYKKTEAVLSVLGGTVIIVYFTFRGRAPMRVWEPVLFAVLFVLISSYNRNKVKDSLFYQKRGNLVFTAIIFLILWYSTGQIIAKIHFHKPQSVFTSRSEEDVELFDQTIKQEKNLYIWPNIESQVLLPYMNIGKLPTNEVLMHNISVGDWTYGQPYYINHLKSVRAENPAAALLERPNTYLMEGYDSVFIEYMKAYYGADVVPVEAGEVNGVKAYELKHCSDEQ